MNVDEMPPPPGCFADRLEAELVRLVSERAARQRSPSRRVSRRAAAAMRRPAVRAGVLAAGTAIAAAAGFAFAGPSHGDRPAAPAQTEAGTAGGAVHIRTAAFTVDSYTDGTLRVTWDKGRYIQDSRDIASLQQALRAAGFPVLIRQGVFCRGPDDSGQLGAGGVGPGVGQVMTGQDEAGGAVAFIFTPSAMPAGEELFIGYLSPAQLAITHGRPGSIERLVPAGVPLTCTTRLPLSAAGESAHG